MQNLTPLSPPPARALRAAIAALALATLACSTVYRWIGLEGPEDRATDVFPGPLLTAAPPTEAPPPTEASRATRTPRPTAEPLPSPSPQPTLPAAFDNLDQFEAALLPEQAADARLFPDATRYVIDVTVDFLEDGSATLAGRVRLRFTNTYADPLPDLYLMLWPNGGEQYLSDMRLGAVRVDGQPVEPDLEWGGLAARLPLDQPLEPGGQVEVSADFDIHAYPGIEDSGAARFGLTRRVLLAPTFYPLVPRRVDGAWQAEPAPSGGDTTNSDSAFYLWRVTAPAGLAVIGSGSVVDTQTAGGRQTVTLAAGPMRDLALVVGPLQLTRQQAGEVWVNAYALEENAEYAGDLLDFSVQQMRLLQDRVGPYPFAELDVVDAPGAFGGIEYPGVIFIGVVDGTQFFMDATVHEVAHQWFYSVVGNDQLLEPWLDEAMATYAEVLYREEELGERSAQGMLDYLWGALYFADDPDQPVGLPVAEYGSENDYGLLVYFKGALFFDVLRQQMGDEAFFDFLASYYQAYFYGFADAAGLQSQAEAACGCDLDALFDLWVYKGGPVTPP